MQSLCAAALWCCACCHPRWCSACGLQGGDAPRPSGVHPGVAASRPFPADARLTPSTSTPTTTKRSACALILTSLARCDGTCRGADLHAGWRVRALRCQPPPLCPATGAAQDLVKGRMGLRPAPQTCHDCEGAHVPISSTRHLYICWLAGSAHLQSGDLVGIALTRCTICAYVHLTTEVPCVHMPWTRWPHAAQPAALFIERGRLPVSCCTYPL